MKRNDFSVAMPAAAKILLLSILVLSATVAGCGRSQQGAGRQEDVSGICPAIRGTGLVVRCEISGSDSTVHVMINNDDDQAARNACADVSGRVAQQASRLTGQWMLQVYSPYRSDKALAACQLH